MKKNLFALSILTIALTACSDSLKTQAELSELSYEGFANIVCEAITNSNFEQLQPISGEKSYKRMKKVSKN